MSAAEALQRKLLDEIPSTRSLGLEVLECSADRVCLHAPLCANHNDKGTAFAGSLSALMTLAGWALIYCRLAAVADQYDIVIHHGQVRYQAPVRSDFVALAELGGENWPDFEAQLQNRGRGRILIPTRIEADGAIAAQFDGYYVALRRN